MIFLCLCTQINFQHVFKMAHDKMRSGADLNGDNLQISTAYHCGSVITVGLGLGFGSGSGLGSGLELRLGLGLRLQTVVYKLLEKVRKCGSVT